MGYMEFPDAVKLNLDKIKSFKNVSFTKASKQVKRCLCRYLSLF